MKNVYFYYLIVKLIVMLDRINYMQTKLNWYYSLKKEDENWMENVLFKSNFEEKITSKWLIVWYDLPNNRDFK